MTPDEYIRAKYGFPQGDPYDLGTDQWLESMEEYAALQNGKSCDMQNMTLVQ